MFIFTLKIKKKLQHFFFLIYKRILLPYFFFIWTGVWMRKGLGTVKTVEGKLLWTFSAPHLGYWIVAPPSSTTGKLSDWLETIFSVGMEQFYTGW